MRAFVLSIVCLVLLASCGPKQPADTASPSGGGAEAGKDGTAQADASATKKEGPETIPLSGTFTSEQIQAAVNDGAALFDACYTLGADKAGKLEGKVTMQVTVGPLGTVKDASVSKSTIKNPKVDACVLDAFKKLTFPKPENGSTVMFTYPMTFGGEVVTKK